MSSLTASDMLFWMAYARKVLVHARERPLVALELTGALSGLGWGGWKLVALSYVSTNTHKMLGSHPVETLELLAVLNRAGRLGEMDLVWKQRVGTWVEGRLEGWLRSEDSVRIVFC